MITCVCNAVSDKKIRWLVQNGATSLKEVMATCKAGGDCGLCISEVRAIVYEIREQLSLADDSCDLGATVS